MDITLDAYIEDGSNTSIADLHLIPANGYSIARDGIGAGVRSWVKETATSPFVHSRAVVAQRLDVMTALLTVRIRAASTAQLFTRYSALIRAAEQSAWTLRLVMDGQTTRWRCETADSSVGESGVLDSVALMQHFQLVHLSIPRHPVPVTGPF
jgi:hypothetical protein